MPESAKSEVAATDDAPPPASGVVLAHRPGRPDEIRMPLHKVAAILCRTPPQGCGVGSRVWRFSMPGLVEGRPPAPGEAVYALKWATLDDPIRRLHLPREGGWLRRLPETPWFPKLQAHGLLHELAYLVVTDWIEGRNLALHGPAVVADLLAAGHFDRFAADLLRIQKTLEAAGIVHSDIWESNVVERDLRPVLLDFGWARDVGAPPPEDNMHEPDDGRAVTQLLLRLAAIRRALLAPHAPLPPEG